MSVTAPTLTPVRRAAAGLIAACGLVGLGLQLASSTDYTGSFPGALWAMARYYTHIGNLLIALCMAALALGRPWAARPLVTGGVTLNALLIGLVYAILLGNIHLAGESHGANIVLHRVVPIAVTLFWLALIPRGGLVWRDPLAWAVPPLVYLGYVLVRGEIDGRFPYFFINLAKLGWLATLRNAVLLTLAFMALGALMVGFDRLLAGRRAA